MSNASNDRPNYHLVPNPLADFIAEQNRAQKKISPAQAFAKKLDKDGKVHLAYAIIDPLASTYGMFRWGVNACNASNNLDLVHVWLMSPSGIIGTALLALFLVSTSFIAAWFDKKKNNPTIVQYIVEYYPDAREGTKGLKNTYRGWQSSTIALDVLGCGLHPLLTPIALGFGILSCMNRISLHNMREHRKDLMKENIALYEEIMQLKHVNAKESKAYLNKIKKQTKKRRAAAYVQVAYNGFFDGQYLYVGPLSVAIIAPALMIPMIALGAFFVLACIISRIYEEYNYQLQLTLTQTQIKLGIQSKELATVYNKYCALCYANKEIKSELLQEIADRIKEFEKTRSLLLKQSRHTWTTAFLAGLLDGLTAYSAMNSMVFTVVTLCLMSGTPVPPLFIVISLIVGAVLLLSCLFFTLWKKHTEVQNTPIDKSFDEQLTEVRNHFLREGFSPNNDPNIDAMAFEQTIGIRVFLTKLPPVKLALAVYEVIRSCWAGLGKGKNFISLSCNSLQVMNHQGHYQDTPIMWILSTIFAIIFSLVFALRAFAKGLGKDAVRINNPLPEGKTPNEFIIAKEAEEKDESEDESENEKSFAPKDIEISTISSNKEKRLRLFPPSHTPVRYEKKTVDCQNDSHKDKHFNYKPLFPEYYYIPIEDTKSKEVTPKELKVQEFKNGTRKTSFSGPDNFFSDVDLKNSFQKNTNETLCLSC